MRVITKICIYTTIAGKTPFIDWIERLKDKKMRYKIKERLDRIQLGKMGDYKRLGNNLGEFRFNFGPGYRVYFGTDPTPDSGEYQGEQTGDSRVSWENTVDSQYLKSFPQIYLD